MSCENTSPNSSGETSIQPFKKMLDNYYDEGLKLNPMNATYTGDTRYNHLFSNTLSEEHKAELKNYYSNYLKKLSEYKDAELTDSEKISKAVLKWDCEINLEELNFRTDLFPMDQMWSVNLVVGQFASGSSAQPFKTVADYNKWLQRLEGYLKWLASAESRMKEGMASGYVLPKSLIVKVLPQLEAMTVENLDEHLFYSPIKNMPASFSEEDKNKLTGIIC